MAIDYGILPEILYAAILSFEECITGIYSFSGLYLLAYNALIKISHHFYNFTKLVFRVSLLVGNRIQ